MEYVLTVLRLDIKPTSHHNNDLSIEKLYMKTDRETYFDERNREGKERDSEWLIRRDFTCVESFRRFFSEVTD